MATRRQLKEDAPYRQSRAALREMYGSRRIDASAPQSSRDFTPSGRQRYWEGRGYVGAEAKDKADQGFTDALSGRQATPNAAPQAAAPINAGAASQFNAPNANFDPANPTGPMVPVSGGGNSFAPPSYEVPLTPLAFSLDTPSPLPASTLASYAPSSPAQYQPPWRRNTTAPYRGGVLASANRWLT